MRHAHDAKHLHEMHAAADTCKYTTYLHFGHFQKDLTKGLAKQIQLSGCQILPALLFQQSDPPREGCHAERCCYCLKMILAQSMLLLAATLASERSQLYLRVA